MTPLKTQCCGDCIEYERLPAGMNETPRARCINTNCPCHQKSVGEDDHKYAVEVKLLDRFYDLYEAGKKDGAPQNYISYFEARTFLLTEVEKALAKNERAAREEMMKQLADLYTVHNPHRPRLSDVLQDLNNQPEV